MVPAKIHYPRTDRLRAMMRPYHGPQHCVVGVSIWPGDHRIIHDGQQSADDLIFEIGSITKVFTAILLCVQIEEGLIDPHAPLHEMSDALADVPPWITAQSLASHSSGLPRIHVPIWKALLKPLPKDPYATFSRADLLQRLRDWRGKPPGQPPRHRYSNLGMGLLGEAMAMQAGKPFDDLLAEKVTGPLGLRDTTASLDPDQLRRFVPPRASSGATVPPWTFQAMAAAGCLRSTARDLARFSQHVIRAMRAPETPLDHAIRRSAQPVLPLRGGSAQCYGWRSAGGAIPFLWHDGARAGSTCALYVCPDRSEAAAILSNNGVAANLWRSIRLDLSNQPAQARRYFAAVHDTASGDRAQGDAVRHGQNEPG